MTRVAPVERTKARIRELIDGTLPVDDPRGELVKLAVQRIVEEALEAATRDVLGRGHYERRSEGDQGYRNGYREGRLKTSEGEVRFAVPQLREADATDVAALRDRVSGRTERLERLALEMYARGCSVRDIEEVFRDAEGKCLLSRTAVSEVTEALWAEYEEFATRDLSDTRPAYLFLDGIAERLRPGMRREAILCAWAITFEGKKTLLYLAPGTKETTESCKEMLQDLKRRGMADPVLVATDGAAGLVRAAEEVFPRSLRQRCLAHKLRNIGLKLPDEAHREVLEAARAAYQAPSKAMAKALREDLVERYGKLYPSAVACFEEDFEACVAHLRCPPTHRKAIRTTNMLERLFLEERRRVKAAGHLFGERPVLKLMYGALIRVTEKWRGIRMHELERRQLERLQEQLDDEHRKEVKPVVETRSTPNRIYSKNRT